MFVPKAPKLEYGKVYFLCGYYVRDLPIPEIETWIYLGSNIYEEDQNENKIYHYFGRPVSYLASTILEERKKYESKEEALEVADDYLSKKLRIEENDIEASVYDYNGLLEWVSELAELPNAEKIFLSD